MGLLENVKRGRENNPPRLMVYGTEGVGKSTFASGAPNPIFIQTEDGLGEIDCQKFPLARTFDEVMKSIEALYTEKHDFGAVVVDSIDWMERLIWDRVCRDFPVKYNSIEKVDGGYGKGYIHALTHWREFLTALNGLRHEKQMVVILIGHAKIEKFEEPGSPAFDRFSPKVHKHASAMIVEWCDAVLFAGSETDVSTKQKNRFLKAVSGQNFVAKNRFHLPEKLPLSWNDLVGCISPARSCAVIPRINPDTQHGSAASGERRMKIELPYPPSVNHYWRHVGPRVLISRNGRIFRDQVCRILSGLMFQTLVGPLAVRVDVYPPDRRRRDLDNIQKGLLDALQHGHLYEDDSQIVDLHLLKYPCLPPGKIIVEIEEVSHANG